MANAHILAGYHFGAALADNNLTGPYRLTGKELNAEVFRL